MPLLSHPFLYSPPADPWLSPVHVDDDLLILNKPSGLLTVPGKTPDLADCLEARAMAEWPGARIVHRLDMDTSGILVMARNPAAQRHLGHQFERRQMQKRYIARVEGVLEPREGVVDLPLRCDWPNRPLQMVCHENGRASLTEWRVIGREIGARGREATRVALMPKTGRSHQLRVHMLALGHPILGDSFYGDRTSAPRLQLHAKTLRMRHPSGGAWVEFTARCPF